MRPFWLRSLFDNKPARRPLGRPSARLRIEDLEARDVPATVTLSGSTLTYTAGAGINNNASIAWIILLTSTEKRNQTKDLRKSP